MKADKDLQSIFPEIDKEYAQIHKNSITPGSMETFWKEQAEEISWFKKPTKILDASNPPFIKWFMDGKLNMCYNCLDRHIEAGYGETKALIWESCYGQPSESYTYNQMYKEVNRLSSLLLKQGVKKGDRVLIYLPVIPLSFFAMMACWRIGAIHVVVFGGFAAGELASRIIECTPKIIITASCGIEPRKKVIYMNFIDSALSKAEEMGHNYKIGVLLYQRKTVLEVPQQDLEKIQNNHKNTLIIIDYEQSINSIDSNIKIKCEEIDSTDPIYILYTSGTTKKAKGIVRDLGGCAVSANFTMSKIMNLNRGEIMFGTSDIGWIVGHLFMVYGPLIRGATTLLMEGKPTGTPDSSVCFKLIQKYKAKIFYSCPTVMRVYKLEDPELKIISQYDLSSLETLALSGERCDLGSFEWSLKIAGKDKMINDHWWQTESGYPICCNNINIKRRPCTPGITGYPMLGFDVHLFDDVKESKKEILTLNTKGLVCVKLPTPPSFMSTFYGHDELF
ncbi:MAG: AMP-binding protein, partial [archaeon]|nr:AMP-binding protein [archaeon]